MAVGGAINNELFLGSQRAIVFESNGFDEVAFESTISKGCSAVGHRGDEVYRVHMWHLGPKS